MSERALQVTEKCEAFTKSLRAMFDAALPCPPPPSLAGVSALVRSANGVANDNGNCIAQLI